MATGQTRARGCWRLRRRTLLACVVLAAGCVALNAGGLLAAPADLAVIQEALDALRTRHWNTHLDFPAIIQAGVAGIRRALQESRIEGCCIDDIPSGQNERFTLETLGARLDRATQIAAGRIPDPQLRYAALGAMFKAVGGSHTRFLDPQQVAATLALAHGGSYGGIGILLGSKEDGQWVIGGVAPDGPAARAGVWRGDAVLKVDDVAVGSLEVVAEVQRLILGDAGTSVQLTLRRGTRELATSIVRERVRWPVARSRMLDGGMGYLQLYGYPEGAAKEIRRELAQLLEARPRALIVDLRENGGGSTREFLDTISLFLPPDTVVWQGYRRDGATRTGKTAGTPIIPSIPIAALIDLGTASNGELTAAALKESGGATLVGQHTAGELETSQIDPIRLSDGSGVKVAFERVRSGQDIEIEGQGYPADIVVRQDPEATQDVQLDRAIQLLRQRLSLRHRRAAWEGPNRSIIVSDTTLRITVAGNEHLQPRRDRPVPLLPLDPP